MSQKKTFRIGLDARCLANAKQSGVENYVSGLIEELLELDYLKLFLFVDRRMSNAAIGGLEARGARVVRAPFVDERKYWAWVSLWRRLYRIKLFHAPLAVLPKAIGAKTVITIYDLTSEVYPHFYTQEELELQRKSVRESARRADFVITISEATKKDLVKFYGLPESKVGVTYPITRTNLTPAAGRELPHEYILGVGNIQPRKNFVNAVKAVALLEKGIHLVIAGKGQDEAELGKLRQEISAAGLSARIHITGYVRDEALAALYRDCRLLLYPSLYEGFGMPIIEAFAQKVPVVTSNLSCMPEIAGDAAIYCDPENPESIAEACSRVLKEPELRTELVARGERRLRELKKKGLGIETANIYRNIIGED